MAILLQHTHTRLTALCQGLHGWAGTRKVKPIWILLKQETVSGTGISWAVLKSAPRSRQITTPAPHHSVFYRPDALPAAQPTASKHWRRWYYFSLQIISSPKRSVHRFQKQLQYKYNNFKTSLVNSTTLTSIGFEHSAIEHIIAKISKHHTPYVSHVFKSQQ